MGPRVERFCMNNYDELLTIPISCQGPPLFGLYPNGLFTIGLFMIGLLPFGLPMMFGLSPFGLF